MRDVTKERKVSGKQQHSGEGFTCINNVATLHLSLLQVLENKRLDLDASKSKVKKSRKEIMEQRAVSV